MTLKNLPSSQDTSFLPPTLMDVLTIYVLETSTNTAVFRVQVRCDNTLLLNFWRQKTFYYNSEVEQTSVQMQEDCSGLEFVLRVRHRCSRLPNDYYLSPFLVSLCLDALFFRYELPPSASGSIREAMRGNCLELRRSCYGTAQN